MSEFDTNQTRIYNKTEVDAIVFDAVNSALQQYEHRRTNLDNVIMHQVDLIAPEVEGMDLMNHRQKITINGQTQWRNFSSIQELVDLVTEVVKNGGQNASAKNKKIKVKDYLLKWFTIYRKPKLGANYCNNYISLMNKHIIPAIGEKSIVDVTVEDIQNIMNTLHSASTAKQVKSILSMMIDAAIADEIYVRPNPCKDKRLSMPTAKTKREGLDNDNLAKLIRALPKLPADYSKLLVMLIMTGCRRGEALGARWEDIDWENNTIHLQRVVRFLNNKPIVSEKMKSKAANRTVSLWRDFIPYLGEPKESGFIINSNNNPLTERQYMNRWNAIIKLLKTEGIENRFTAHQLRHTYATIAANSGNIPPKVLQGMLGHSNFQTTMNIYAGIDANKIKESSEQLHGEYAKLSNESCRKVADYKEPQTVET